MYLCIKNAHYANKRPLRLTYNYTVYYSINLSLLIQHVV